MSWIPHTPLPPLWIKHLYKLSENTKDQFTQISSNEGSVQTHIFKQTSSNKGAVQTTIF